MHQFEQDIAKMNKSCQESGITKKKDTSLPFQKKSCSSSSQSELPPGPRQTNKVSLKMGQVVFGSILQHSGQFLAFDYTFLRVGAQGGWLHVGAGAALLAAFFQRLRPFPAGSAMFHVARSPLAQVSRSPSSFLHL